MNERLATLLQYILKDQIKIVFTTILILTLTSEILKTAGSEILW